METIFRSPENKYSFRVINTSNLVILRSKYHSKLHFIWVKDINEDRRSYNNPIIFVKSFTGDCLSFSNKYSALTSKKKKQIAIPRKIIVLLYFKGR